MGRRPDSQLDMREPRSHCSCSDGRRGGGDQSQNPASNLTIPELRKLFAGEKRSWAGGLSVKLIVRAPGTHEREVLLKLLGVSESEYKQYWASRVMRGEAQSEPLVLPSLGMQREAMGLFDGGITLVAAENVKPGMKVVKVNGRMPGEAGYPLH